MNLKYPLQINWGSEIWPFLLIWCHFPNFSLFVFVKQVKKISKQKLVFHLRKRERREATVYSYGPNHSKTGPFKIWTFLSRFQIVFAKLAAICLDFIWSGFQISDPIRNQDHLQPNLFSTFEIQNSSDFRSPLYIPGHCFWCLFLLEFSWFAFTLKITNFPKLGNLPKLI